MKAQNPGIGRHEKMELRRHDMEISFYDDIMTEYCRGANRNGMSFLFEDMYDWIRDKIRRECRRKTPTHDVEDIIQETMYAILAGIDSFHGNSRFTTWVEGIIQNKCKAYINQQQKARKQFHPLTDEDSSLIVIFHYSSHRRMERCIADLECCLSLLIESRTLGNVMHSVLVYLPNHLCSGKELPCYRQIAQEWACSENTATKRIKRAFDLIRSSIYYK